MLSILTFLPVVGAIIVLLAPSDRLKKGLAFGAAIATFVVSLLLLPGWQEIPDMQFVERYAWMPDLNIYYHLGVDGISLWLVVLTTLLMPIAVAFSNQHIKENIGSYLALMLLMETAVLGRLSRP